MKVRLAVHQPPYSGYLNVDPVPILEEGKDYNVSQTDFRNLDNVCSQSSLFELLCDDVLDYIPRTNLRAVLSNWVSKLRHSGKITLSGTDIYEVCRLFLTGSINNEEFNVITHGSHNDVWDVKLSQSTLNEVTDLLSEFGLKIVSKSLDGFRFFIEAVRE